MAPNRFAPFSDDELLALWEGMALDDGLRYADDPTTAEGRVLVEIERDMRRRDMRPSQGFGFRGDPVWSHPDLMGSDA